MGEKIYSWNASRKDPIVLEHVFEKLGSKYVLNDITISVKEGTIFSLIGPNGAGKTTTVRVLSGLLNPCKGNVFVFGEKDNYFDKISVVLEKSILWEKFTGIRNILMMVNVLGLDANRAVSIATEYANLFHLSDVLEKPVYTYSKGMKRKLSFIIALMKNSPILILDEPNSGIDPKSKVDIRNMLFDLRKDGKTIFVTSHDLGEVEKISDSIAIINKGKIVVSGKTKEIVRTGNIKIVVEGIKTETFPEFISYLEEKHFSYGIKRQEIKIKVPDERNVREIMEKAFKEGFNVKEISTEESLENIYLKILKEEGGKDENSEA